jgi:glyoxylase-like metal-dependent hydrolase (beta-lactamase superfamily II)
MDGHQHEGGRDHGTDQEGDDDVRPQYAPLGNSGTLIYTAQQLTNVASSDARIAERTRPMYMSIRTLIAPAEAPAARPGARRTIHGMVSHVTAPTAGLLDVLPAWVTLLRAPNPGPMTLDGTNTWVLGPERIVIDPGPADEAHLAAIAAHAPISTILLTHGHADHVEGAARLSGMLGGVPVRAADPARCLRGEPLADGDDVDGIRVVAVPGHTADSVAFRVRDAVFSGDTILGRGTTVVAWPDGDLGDYLASLRRLETQGPVPVLPGHGPALADCAAAAAYYLRHRLARLEQVRAARAGGAEDAEQVVRVVYADVDPALWPAAEWSVRAQLAYLDGEREHNRPPSELDEP